MDRKGEVGNGKRGREDGGFVRVERKAEEGICGCDLLLDAEGLLIFKLSGSLHLIFVPKCAHFLRVALGWIVQSELHVYVIQTGW